MEVLAPNNYAQLNTITVSLYNSSGQVYGSHLLSVFKTEEKAIYGSDRIYYLDVPTGLSETKGGFSLSTGNNLIQFISYGGAIQATGGPASGVSSQDVGITETATDGANNSIYIMEMDNRGVTTPIWTKSVTNSNTKGFANWDMNQTLPVELLYFRAQSSSKGVSLSWATASEQDNEKFIVERSLFQTADFKSITNVKGAGTTHQEQHYRFVDEKPLTGTTYYRLKQIDYDGKTTYSPIVAVQPKRHELKLSVYPNPVSEELTFDLGHQTANEKVQVQIVNTIGRIVYNQELQALSGYKVPVAGLPAGTYYLLVTRNGKKESKSFIKI